MPHGDPPPKKLDGDPAQTRRMGQDHFPTHRGNALIACHRYHLKIKLDPTIHTTKKGRALTPRPAPCFVCGFQTGYPALSTAPWLPEDTILE